MFQLDLKSRKSIYEQIIDGFKGMIIRGELAGGDKLPSVRELSAMLTVNPNTIQKAYAALDAQGWIYSVTGRGCFVSDGVHAVDDAEAEALYGMISELVSQLEYIGVPREAILEHLEKDLREESDKK